MMNSYFVSQDPSIISVIIFFITLYLYSCTSSKQPLTELQGSNNFLGHIEMEKFFGIGKINIS